MLGEATHTQPDTRGEERVRPAATTRAPSLAAAVTASAALTALVVLLYLHNRAAPGTSQFFDPVAPAVALSAPAVGWLIVSRRLADLAGRLLCASGLVGAAGDWPGTDALLARLKTELRSEIADIRALVDQLRPRSLDELGLVGAVRRQAALAGEVLALLVGVIVVTAGGALIVLRVTDRQRLRLARSPAVALEFGDTWYRHAVVLARLLGGSGGTTWWR